MSTSSIPLNTSRMSVRTLGVSDANELDARDILDLLREAMRRACGSLKAAAIDLGIDPGQLSRQLAGIERAPVADILARHVTVREEFAFLLAQRLGLQPRSLTVEERRRHRLRMLKVQLLAELDEELRESA